MIRFPLTALLVLSVLFTVSAVPAIDLTSAGHLSPAESTHMEQTRLARYLTILPFSTGDTVRNAWHGELNYPGSYDFACWPDGEADGFGLCDGYISAVANDDQCGTLGYEKDLTWEEATGDYQGYRFKHPVTITRINWENMIWKRVGTFYETPEVQILDGPLEAAIPGTWTTVAVSWDVPYDNTFSDPITSRPYQITLDTPAVDVWGVRLFGICAPSTLDPTGCVDSCELQVSGTCSLTGQVGLANNLALGQTPIWSRPPVYDEDPKTYSGTLADPNLLTDGLYGENECDGRTAKPDDSGTTDFVGVKFDGAQADVTAVGITMYYNAHPDEEFPDNGSGYLQQDTIRVQYTTDTALDPDNPDASTWVDVTGLDMGRLPEMETELKDTLIATGQSRYVHTELLTFDEIDADITGIRMIGTPAPLGSFFSEIDLTGYLDVQEFEVFATASTLPPVPGDTNGDRIVDASDAQVLANNWGNNVTAGDYTSGDFNNDGVVDAADASILAANWGNHNEGIGEGIVPEPSALAFLLALGAPALLRRRKT